MIRAIGACFALVSSFYSHLALSNECLKYLNDPAKPLVLGLNTTLIKPEPQFITPEQLAQQVVQFIKTDPMSLLFEDIRVDVIRYDQLKDQITFVVEYKIKSPASVDIVLTKEGVFTFSEAGQIIGFSLDPLFGLKPAPNLTKQDETSYYNWLIGFMEKTNFWKSKSRFLFEEPKEIHVAHEAQFEMPILLAKKGAKDFALSLEASIWLSMPVELRKQIDSISVDNFGVGEFGLGSFVVTIGLNDRVVRKSGYKLISRAHINKNGFSLFLLDDNFDYLDQDVLSFDEITYLMDIREHFRKNNPYRKIKFEIEPSF